MLWNSEEFGALVKAKRKLLGLTQAELARRCGTGERFIIELEAGKPTCQLGKSLTAAREVGIHLQDANALTSAPSANADEVVDDLAFLPKF